MGLFEERKTDEELAEIAGNAIATAAIEREKNNSRKMLVTAIVVLAIIITAIISIGVARISFVITNGTSDGLSEVNQIIEDIAQGVYDQFYQVSYDHAERENHVSNRATIVLGEVKEIAKLEVLKVTTVENIVEQKDDNKDMMTLWVEYTGEGVYTVDLEEAEYLVDNSRHSVIVRLPGVQLSTVSVNSGDILLFENKWGNDSIMDGVQLNDEQKFEATMKINEKFSSTPEYIECAERSAVKMLTEWITEINSDIPDLTVTVEFME